MRLGYGKIRVWDLKCLGYSWVGLKDRFRKKMSRRVIFVILGWVKRSQNLEFFEDYAEGLKIPVKKSLESGIGLKFSMTVEDFDHRLKFPVPEVVENWFGRHKV